MQRDQRHVHTLMGRRRPRQAHLRRRHGGGEGQPLSAHGIAWHLAGMLWFGTVLTVLVASTLLLTAATRSGGELRRSAAHMPAGAVGRARLPAQPPHTLHWTDVDNSTTFLLTTTQAPSPVAASPLLFTFGLPNGDQLRGSTFLQQDTSTSPLTLVIDIGKCQQGVLAAQQPALRGVPTRGDEPNAFFFLQARIDQNGLLAYARVAYLQLGTGDTSQFCATQTGGTTAVMQSGCDQKACGPSPLDTAAPAVASYDGDVIKAAAAGTAQSWEGVYNATERAVTAQYTPEEFARIMQQQAGKVGKIVAITAPTGPVTVQYDSAGQAYFALAQTVTLQKDGKTTSRQVTSYYLLEGGQWLFWFTA